MNLPEKEPAPVYAVVMAGGHGTRLWPLSRTTRPKQFLAFGRDGRTMIQNAVRRAVAVAGRIENVLVVIQADHAGLAGEQLPHLPPENLLLEPQGRNTAACIGLAALHSRRRSSQAVLAVFPADHLIVDEDPWVRAVLAGVEFAAAYDRLAAIGISPESASPSYGYLHLGEQIHSDDDALLPVFEVRAFIEKPGVEKARRFLESGEYLWNTGTFAWQASTYLQAVQTHLPALYAGLQELDADLDDRERLESVYPRLPAISVDYGVMEKADNLAAVRGQFHRIDIGNLEALSALWQKDASGNASQGLLAARDSEGNLIFTDNGLVGLIGVRDLVVVRHEDIVLVCPRDRAAEVKELLKDLQAKHLGEFV